MGPFAALNSVIANAFNFSGRASRSEFWWFFLWEIIIGFVVLAIDIWTVFIDVGPHYDFTLMSTDPFNYLATYWAILSFIPRLSLTIRRLHDGGFSGFWYLLVFVPFGSLVVFIFMFLPSDSRHNNYGPPRTPMDGRMRKSASGKTKNPMNVYASMEASRNGPTPEMVADRKAQVRALYEQRVLGQTQKPA